MTLGANRVAVVGAGIGGLVAALELAHAGMAVTVYERASGPGGKMRTISTEAGPVDAGPTVFSLPWVFEELFEAVGLQMADHVTLRPLDILARHHWRGDTRLDLYADQAKSEDAVGRFAGAKAAAEFRAFSDRAQRLFEAFVGPVMQTADPTPLSVGLATLPRAGQLLRDMAPARSMARMLEQSFTDPRLRQLFGRYATYVGGSPYRSPAILALIWQAEAAGVSAVEGGMAALAKGLEAAGRGMGVQYHYGCDVEEIAAAEGRVTHLLLADGTQERAETVLFNGDPAALGAGLLGDGTAKAAQARPRAKRSLSAWVWTFAADPADAGLAHHNVCFSDDYRSEFADLTDLRRVPSDPTLYLCAQDAGAAPGAKQRFQIIMNAPADGDVITPTDQEIRTCETRVFTRLREAGIPLEIPQAENALTTPWDFNTLFPGTGGAIYGTSPHGMMTTFQRPRARTSLAGLYLAGGAVHPGPGVPMAALSGRQAAAAILADRVSTSRSALTGMRGGISMDSVTTANAASRSSAS